MIRKMKKLSLFVFHEDKEKTLNDLASLGLVHIEIANGVSSEEIDNIAAKKHDASRAKAIINNALADAKKAKKDVSNVKAENTSKKASEVIENVINTSQASDKLKTERDTLKKELSVVAPFGNFSFDKLNDLKEKTGYNTLFYSANAKEYNDYKLSELKDIFTCTIKEEGGKVYFVAFKKEGTEETLPFDIINMPSKSYNDINARIAELDKEIENNETEIIKNQVYIEAINKEIDTLNISNHFEEAKESFVASEGTEGKILYVEAYVPKDKESEVKSLLDAKNIAYILEDPSKDDKVPVELKNNKYSGAYELITKLFQLPNYFEIDLTPMIAVFYPLFFAYCFGDSGYGVVLTIVALIGLFTVLKGSLRGVGILALTLGICTTIMGIINGGSVFGVSIPSNTQIPLFAALSKYLIITDTKENWFLTPFNTALLIGVLHICFALVVGVVDRIKTSSIGDILGAIGKLLFIPGLVLWFLGDMQKMEVIKQFSTIYYALIAVGLVFLVILSNVGKKPDVLNSILGVYFAATGIMGDTLSYIRLFALGASGSILALVINQIGMSFKAIPGVGVVIMVVFLVVGHIAIFLLNILGALVHPLRLTFVEFYNNVGFEGGGKEYKPLKKAA
ncbi:V-type ATPase 116kDa subunit family protein [Brachyspira innocens]|uniref:V-type ATPase 116kDa subunit family protein n=1 Tax=Brachyspira innocens TaxID=13264 RepID=A0ABT8YZ86_9SPIR|nr:V-type ATPase 116kDa subunit family protein [Brachyspira innocens]MDO6993450.1 V-type ATPase 116kDa subunit family protein [Brachyspira innocens]MDO7020875.1 V-type ATPase 116kDa subunit family protein [Brachyspira innocens]